jgi:hypothetical protein
MQNGPGVLGGDVFDHDEVCVSRQLVRAPKPVERIV